MTNVYNLFKFLKDRKGKEIPFMAKLLYAPEAITKDELHVKGSLNLSNTLISSLPDNLTVDGYLDLAHVPITTLPNNLKVGGYFDLRNTKITSLPDNLQVENSLFLHHTKINSIPNNLYIGRHLFLKGTPLLEKYSKEEIRKMIEDKGGYVGGKIYTTI